MAEHTIELQDTQGEELQRDLEDPGKWILRLLQALRNTIYEENVEHKNLNFCDDTYC